MTCPVCGFEAHAWASRDVRSLLDALGWWWGNVPDATARGPAPQPSDDLDSVHKLVHQMIEVSSTVRGPASDGRVESINVSDGGVPKRSVASASVTWTGVEGDRQADTKHHGRAYQALCLWSTDVISTLAALGHPIAPGLAGENVTLSGIDWAALTPGTRVRIGTVLAEISFPATPCAKQAKWFVDGDFGVMDHDRNPQWTRWYAWVRAPGEIATGDAVIVNP